MPSYKFILAAALALTSAITSVNGLCRPPPPVPPELDGASPADDTSGLTWVVVSGKKGSTNNNKQVKLSEGTLVVVDSESPALVTNFRGGTLYSAAGNGAKSTDLGPTGFLNLTAPATSNHIVKLEFRFGNVTAALNATTVLGGKPDASWELVKVDPKDGRTQKLYHGFDGSQLQGFALCPKGSSGTSQLFYMVSYSGEQWDAAGCENVVLQTTVTVGKQADEAGCRI
ncbi:hypothetical protein F4677DRAFT_424912 [Hypoxylon crocopeplum]|nr:hypothetical protein F4677DRAFT_424912 [Hypoxylon crocopeplum]